MTYESKPSEEGDHQPCKAIQHVHLAIRLVRASIPFIHYVWQAMSMLHRNAELQFQRSTRPVLRLWLKGAVIAVKLRRCYIQEDASTMVAQADALCSHVT